MTSLPSTVYFGWGASEAAQPKNPSNPAAEINGIARLVYYNVCVSKSLAFLNLVVPFWHASFPHSGPYTS